MATVLGRRPPPPGELALHTRVFGLGGTERAAPLEVVSRVRTPDAVAWLARQYSNRSLAEWIEAALARPAHCSGGSLGSEAPIERAAVLHCVDATLSGTRYAVPFARWFVVADWRAGDQLLVLVHRALDVRLPFLVASLGYHYVVVPPNGSRRSSSSSRVYTTHCVIEALVAWASAMLDDFGGHIGHSNKSIGDFLRTFLGDR